MRAACCSIYATEVRIRAFVGTRIPACAARREKNLVKIIKDCLEKRQATRACFVSSVLSGVRTVHFKNRFWRARAFVLAAAALVLLAVAPARAQEEAAPTVLDEPVVQVNNDVIMLSLLKRENDEFRDVLTKQRGMTAEQADAEIAKKQAEIIFNLINEALLVQKGKDTPRLVEGSRIDVEPEEVAVRRGRFEDGLGVPAGSDRAVEEAATFARIKLGEYFGQENRLMKPPTFITRPRDP